jgi:hypothetical protein
LVGAPDDAEDVRLSKTLAVAASILEFPAGVLWGGLYLAFGEPGAALIPFAYSFLTLVNLTAFKITRSYAAFRLFHLVLTLLLPFSLMIALGGFVSGSAVIFWSLIAPMGAMVFASRREATLWFLAFLGLVVISGVLQPFVAAENKLPHAAVIVFFILNTVGPSIVAFALLNYFVGQKNTALRLLQKEQEKSERLLQTSCPLRSPRA